MPESSSQLNAFAQAYQKSELHALSVMILNREYPQLLPRSALSQEDSTLQLLFRFIKAIKCIVRERLAQT